MLLLELADVARSAGLTVVETSGWRTRGHGPMSGVRTVVCHHTAGPATGEAPSLGVVRDGRPDLSGPLSHFVLGRSGTVYVVAAGLCWHAGNTFTAEQGDAYAIGIEAEATGVTGWPEVQYRAYAQLCRALIDHYQLPLSKVLGHKEVAAPLGRKIDPNFPMAGFRAAVSQAGGFDVPLTAQDAQLVANALLDTRIRREGNVSGAGQDLTPRAVFAWFDAAIVNAAGRVQLDRVEQTLGSLALGDGQIDLDALARRVVDLLGERITRP